MVGSLLVMFCDLKFTEYEENTYMLMNKGEGEDDNNGLEFMRRFTVYVWRIRAHYVESLQKSGCGGNGFRRRPWASGILCRIQG